MTPTTTTPTADPAALAGAVVLWTISETGTAGWTPADLLRAGQDARIQEDPSSVAAPWFLNFLPSPLSPERAFKRAVADLRKAYGSGAGRVILTQVNDGPEWGHVIAHRVGDLSPAQQAEMDATPEADRAAWVEQNLGADAGAWFRLHKKTGTVSRGGDPLRWGALLDAFDERWTVRGGCYTIRDARSMLVNMLRKHVGAVPLRRGGGVWFAAQHQRDRLDQVCSFFEALCRGDRGKAAGGAAMFSPHNLPLFKGPEASEAVAEAVAVEVETVLSEVEAALDNLGDRLDQGLGVRAATIDVHSDRAFDLIREIELTSEALGFQVEDLEERRVELAAMAEDLREKRMEGQK